jgi:citrate/tricarballylate utilization protein
VPATDTQVTRRHATDTLAEADRLMTVCNSCRYCEGLCAVFPAMEMRRAFPDGDLNYLANLCHGCGACYYDCQFSPPHEFDVNVPRVLAKARQESYAQYAWPPAARALFKRNGLAVTLICALGVAVFVLGFRWATAPGPLLRVETGSGAFYRVMPHDVMVLVFGAAFLYAILAIWMGLRAFWRDIGETPGSAADRGSLWDAIKDTAKLRYLDGGKVGCYNEDERPTDNRRVFHHLTFYGFLLCFASTSTATFYDYVVGRLAPYAWWDLPVVLGTVGGIALVVGCTGLLVAKLRRDPVLIDERRLGMDAAFIAALGLTGLTGMQLLILRDTALMNLLLAIHLGFVVAFFVTMPYSKFMHGIYRFAALVRYAKERRAMLGEAPAPVATTGQGGARP